MAQLDEDGEVLVGQYVKGVGNADLTQTLLQLRSRRRDRTTTARRQTNPPDGRTYADAVTRANPTTNDTNNPNPTRTATNDTADASQSRDRANDVCAARAERRVRRAQTRQSLVNDAVSATYASRDDDDSTRDTPRRHSSRRR